MFQYCLQVSTWSINDLNRFLQLWKDYTTKEFTDVDYKRALTRFVTFQHTTPSQCDHKIVNVFNHLRTNIPNLPEVDPNNLQDFEQWLACMKVLKSNKFTHVSVPKPRNITPPRFQAQSPYRSLQSINGSNTKAKNYANATI